MTSLDDVGALRERDPSHMLQHVAALPEQLARAAAVQVTFREADADFASRSKARGVRDAVVCGMGGSAIGAEYAAVWAAALGARCNVWRDYGLPAWRSAETLWIFSSYSGNTEETLAAFDASPPDAARVCISSGGQLAQRAHTALVPRIAVPAGLPPRAALGHSLVAILVALHESGLVEVDPCADLEAAARSVAQSALQLAPEVPESTNPAKQLARRWHAHVPFFYSGNACLAPVARRLKGQLAENAKCLAFASTLPEMNHNEIMAWPPPRELRERALLFFLHDLHDPTRVERRMQLTAELLGPHGAGVEHVSAQGNSALEHMLQLTHVGDFASVYLAHLYGVDPTPVGRIDDLKHRLERER